MSGTLRKWTIHSTHPAAKQHPPDPECENCDGRGCMGCVMREYDHDCADDCPICCADNFENTPVEVVALSDLREALLSDEAVDLAAQRAHENGWMPGNRTWANLDDVERAPFLHEARLGIGAALEASGI